LKAAPPSRIVESRLEDGSVATAIHVARMTTIEKLRAMEALWEALQATPKDVPSPSWHADVLKARAERARKGRSRFTGWAEAKRRIQARVA
jgi:hypothetical protein